MSLKTMWILYFIFLLLSCDEKEESSPQPSLPGCLQDRNTVQVITDQKGTLQAGGGLLLINVEGSGEVLAPCNLPDNFQEKDQVIFSGNKKEILPNERWAGQPMELTDIEKVE